MNNKPDVVVVGLGYVGLTLAVTLAEVGLRVWGYERQPRVVQSLKCGQSHIFEPGLEEALQRQLKRNLVIEDHTPTVAPEAVIICVSTPLGPGNSPDLGNLESAVETVADIVEGDTLVIVRSTVPVGTSRRVVLPLLQAKTRQAKNRRVRLACCPERTIQGLALKELRQLPQVVGALDEVSQQLAVRLWERVTPQVVTVSSLEAAETVKLINNSHTDLIYAFGNEVALMAGQQGLDPLELIRAANLDYPRPDLARPGFVGGPCLTKDPYLLLSSFKDTAYTPQLITAARSVNESLPFAVANHFIQCLRRVNGHPEGQKVLVCGFAYKGWPVTDDIRGSSTVPMLEVLAQLPLRLYGHDYLVSRETISAMGAVPVEDLEEGFDDARGVLFVNEHPDYKQLDIVALIKRMRPPAVVYDCWRMFDPATVRSLPGVKYVGIGFD